MHALQREKKGLYFFQTASSGVHLLVAVFCMCAIPRGLLADDKQAAKDALPETHSQMAEQPSTTGQSLMPEQTLKSLWKYNGFLDAGYLLGFNHPVNHLFRNRSTTLKVDELDLNMAGAGIKKEATQDRNLHGTVMGGGRDRSRPSRP